MSTYDWQWQWQQGDGPHYWLREVSGAYSKHTGRATSSAGYIEPSRFGWEVHQWTPHRHLATLPDTLEQSELRDTAKLLILLSLKD